MNVEQILNLMDEALDNAWSLPLAGGRSVVDVERLRDLIDEMRANFPNELAHAQAIVAERAEILAGAEREKELMIRRGEEKVKIMISQEEVIKQAQAKANDIITQAKTKAKELKLASHEFSDDTLRNTEEMLTKALTDVRSTRQAIRNSIRHSK